MAPGFIGHEIWSALSDPLSLRMAPAGSRKARKRRRVRGSTSCSRRWVGSSIDREDLNIKAGEGIAVREFKLAKWHGFVDYLLFVDGQAVLLSTLEVPYGNRHPFSTFSSSHLQLALPSEVPLALGLFPMPTSGVHPCSVAS